MAASVAEDGRRRARQGKEARERRQREWYDAIGPLRHWVAGTDVLLAALLWAQGFCCNGSGRWRRLARR
jgi:hypothetical protein